jgi:hypothetical protein
MASKQTKESARNKVDLDAFYALPYELQELLQKWIGFRYRDSDRYWKRRSSYGLRKDFQNALGVFISDEDFRGAMLVAGFTASMTAYDQNLHYKLSPYPRPRSYNARSVRQFIERQPGWWAVEIGLEVVRDERGEHLATKLPSGQVIHFSPFGP